jgi:hypothetical protein
MGKFSENIDGQRETLWTLVISCWAKSLPAGIWNFICHEMISCLCQAYRKMYIKKPYIVYCTGQARTPGCCIFPTLAARKDSGPIFAICLLQMLQSHGRFPVRAARLPVFRGFLPITATVTFRRICDNIPQK